jgi:selT/selW/selH-like putative selenoprotein
LTEEILSERAIEYFVADWKLIPSSGGKFELTINDELVFSKKQLKRHAEPNELRNPMTIKEQHTRFGMCQ